MFSISSVSSSPSESIRPFSGLRTHSNQAHEPERYRRLSKYSARENWDALHFDIRTRLFLGHSKPSLQSTLDLHDEIVKVLIQGKRKLAGRLLRKHSEAFCSGWGEGHQGIPDA
jgi:hypothetical protein